MSQSTPILYGGSGKSNNAVEIFSNKDVDGGLIGGASLNSEDFINIINYHRYPLSEQKLELRHFG